MQTLWRGAIVLALCLSCSREEHPTPAKNNYYVDSVRGSDQNRGTSPAAPWQTLGPIHARRFQPGDVINLARGSSWSEGLKIDDSGIQGRPIIFQAYGSGERPVFSNSGTWSHAISIEASWVVLDGLQAQEAHESGFFITPQSNNNVIRNCVATDVGIGFGVYGQHNLITQNEIRDLHMIADTEDDDDDDYGAVAVSLHDSYNEVSYNRMERCRAPSHDYGTDGGAVELFGEIVGSNIHHNWAADSSGFIEIGGGGARDTIIAYNVSVDNQTFAVIHLEGRFGSAVKNIRVENNTIAERADNVRRDFIIIFVGPPSNDTFTLRNNIVYADGYQAIANEPDFTHEHNIYYCGSEGDGPGFPLARGEKQANPLFVDLDGRDLRLQPGSPAVGAGIPLGYKADFAGNAVPSRPAPNAGAFQGTGSRP